MLKYLKKKKKKSSPQACYTFQGCVQSQSHSFALVLSHCLGGGVITL